MPTLSDGRGLSQPDKGLNGLKLAEEELQRLPLIGIVPVIQKALGNSCDAGISCLMPGFDPRSYLVYQGQLLEDAGIVKGPGSLGGYDIAGWPPAIFQCRRSGSRDRRTNAVWAPRKER